MDFISHTAEVVQEFLFNWEMIEGKGNFRKVNLRKLTVLLR